MRGVHVQEVGGGRSTEGARMLRFADVSARSILRAAWGCMQMLCVRRRLARKPSSTEGGRCGCFRVSGNLCWYM